MSFDTNFYEVRSNQSVAGSSFTGSINYDFVTPNMKVLNASECYGSIDFEISQRDATTSDVLRPALNANNQLYIPYLMPNYPLLCFNSISTTLCNKQLAEVQDPATAITMYENCFLSRSELDTKDGLLLNRQIKKSECTSLSAPIRGTIAVPAKIINIGATATFADYDFSVVQGIYIATGSITSTFNAGQATGPVDTNPFILTIVNTATTNLYQFSHPAITAGATLTQSTNVAFNAIANVMTLAISLNSSIDKRIKYALQQQGVFARGTKQTINFRIPSSLFRTKGYIPHNAPISLRFNISDSYQNNMIGCYNVKPSVVKSIGTDLSAHSIGIYVHDFHLFMRAETMKLDVERPISIPLIQMDTKYRLISSKGSNTLSFSMPNKHISYIIIGFLQQGRGSASKFSSTDFSSGFTNTYPEVKVVDDATSCVESVSVLWGGTLKPQPLYKLNMAETGSNSNARGWSEFISLIESRADRSGSAYDYDTWVNAPLFIYKFSKNTTMDNNIQISVSMSDAYTADKSQMFCTALFNETLKLTYLGDKIVEPIEVLYE